MTLVKNLLASERLNSAFKVCCKQCKSLRERQAPHPFTGNCGCNLIQQCQMAINSAKREGGSGPDKRDISCLYDFDCRIDENCDLLSGECRKINFLVHGEQCYLHSECFPNSECDPFYGLMYMYGHCKNLDKFNQNEEEPNDPLD